MMEIGDIVSIPLNRQDGITPKGNFDTRRKYCVIIGKPDYGYYVAYLVINHAINEKFNLTKELKDSFYPLSHNDYPSFILEHYDPSWLDMSRIREMESSRIETEGTKIGHLTERDFNLVMEYLRTSILLSPKQKRRLNLIE